MKFSLFPRSTPQRSVNNRRRHYFGSYYLRPAKFAPFAIIALFVVFNFTGFFFSPAMAPVVANAATRVETIPEDIPLSGDCDLDWIIFRAGEKAGVDPRFIHAVIKQLIIRPGGPAFNSHGRKAVDHAGENIIEAGGPTLDQAHRGVAPSALKLMTTSPTPR
ncbi:MAG: hypothetical protein ABJA18_13080 [bacterium]